MSGIMNVFPAALSGLNAASTQLAVSADNVANMDTPGFKAARVDTVSLSGGGVGTRVSRDPAAGPIDAEGREGSNTDLATEAVNTIRAKTLYTANAMVIRTADKMVGTLLDMFDGDRGDRGQ